jgi:hypothetical protein
LCGADLLASDDLEFGLVLLSQSLGELCGLLKLVIILSGLADFRLVFLGNDVLVGVLGTGVVMNGVEQLVDVSWRRFVPVRIISVAFRISARGLMIRSRS